MEQCELMTWIQTCNFSGKVHLILLTLNHTQTSLLSSVWHSQDPSYCFFPLSFLPLLPPSLLGLCVSIRVGWDRGVVKHFSSFLIVLTCAIGIPIRPHWFPTAKCIDFYISHWSPLLNLPTHAHTHPVSVSLSLHEQHAGRAWTHVCVWVSKWVREGERERKREWGR